MGFQGNTISILGRSGCGKGTQARFLADWLKERGIEYRLIYLGDLFRKLSQTDTADGREIAALMKAGELPSDSLALKIISAEVASVPPDMFLILDGSPRRIEEARALDSQLLSAGRSSIRAMFLDVSAEECVDRLRKRAGDRHDDKREQAIKNRLEYFEQDVRKTLEYFRENGRLMTVSGEGDPSDIFENFMAELFRTLENG